MSKITEYTSASTFDANDVLLKDGEKGTMIISVEDAASELKRLSGVDDDISGITQTVAQSMGTINSNIAGVETDYIASKDYAIGDLFIVNNVLYKATAAIAEEDIIDTETNCAVVNLGDEIGDIRSELLNKANVDGSYDEFTAGSSKQLLGTVFIEDDEPYLFRTSGGSIDIGDREYDEIVGGSIVWNQMVDVTPAPHTANGVKFDFKDDGTIVVSGTNDGEGDSYVNISNRTGVSNHVIYLCGCPAVGDQKYFCRDGYVVKRDYGSGIIVKHTSTGDNFTYQITVVRNATVENVVFKPQAFDLTQMFGSEIADYIYNLEQATPGAGVAWFRKYFPKDYYEYNAGELMHVSDLQSHDTVGFNLLNLNDVGTIIKSYRVFDLSIGKNSLLKMEFVDKDTSVDVSGIGFGFLSSSYHGETSSPDSNSFKWVLVTSGTISPDNSNALSNGTLFDRAFMYPNSDEAFDKIKRRYDICVHLVWDGERDGEYEPYVKRSYPLDSSLTLRGIPKLSTDGKLYYDGDHYKSDGTVERRYGIVDLGTLEWITRAFGSSNTGFVATQSRIPGVPGTGSDYLANAICQKYPVVTTGLLSASGIDKQMAIGAFYQAGCNIYIVDSDYTDAATFKTAMSGVYLVYELAEPTTEEAQPFQSPQIVDDFGTEEYVTSSIVPVGHTTQYDHNLRAKLEMAPNSPDGDGDYLVRQTGSKNEYVPYTDGGRITALEGKIPAAPSVNGSYILKCTVTDDTATYAWVAE